MENRQNQSGRSFKKVTRKNRKKSPRRGFSDRVPSLLKILSTASVFASVVLVTLAFWGGYVFFTNCDYFNVESVAVTGASVLSQEYVVSKAGLSWLDQKSLRKNILAVNLAAVRQKLLAEPWVVEARVTRKLPGQISIEIQEHSPLAVIDLGEKYFINQTALIFKRLDASDPGTLPLVIGLDYTDLNAAGQLDGRAFLAALELVKTGNQVARLMPGLAVKKVIADRETGLIIESFKQVEQVRLGWGNYHEKFKRLKNILHYWERREDRQGLTAIDLVSPGRAVLRLAIASTSG